MANTVASQPKPADKPKPVVKPQGPTYAGRPSY